MGKGKGGTPSAPAQVWEGQTPFLEDLYSQGQGLFNNPDPNTVAGYNMQKNYADSQPLQNTISSTQNAFNFTSNPFNNQQSQYAQQLGEAGQAGIQSAMNTQGGTQIQGTNFNGFGANNPHLDNAVQSAMTANNRNFNENILSGITDGAVSSGQVGSSRQGIAEGIAARGAHENNANIAAQMYGNAYNQDMNRDLQARGMESQLNQAQGNLSEQGRQFNANRSLNASQYGADAYANNYNTGLNSLQNSIGQSGQVANLGMLPSQIYQNVGNQDWDQLARYQQAIGSPSILSGQGAVPRQKSSTFGAIGTGVGAFFGGPAGAAVGGSIGSSLDS